MKQNLKPRQPLIPDFVFSERVQTEGGGAGGVPKPSSQPKFSADPSSQPNVGPNSSYQICNPISSAPLLTDVYHEVKALTRAVWIMNLH